MTNLKRNCHLCVISILRHRNLL